MMILTWLLTAVLVVDCLFLILLVLVQLPKKEAGAGMAFGGAATDALFGAGSGTALTKITKYAAIVFFVLALALSVISGQRKGTSSIEEKLKEKASQSLPTGAVGTQPSAPTAPAALQNSQATTPPTTSTPAAPTETTPSTPATAPDSNAPAPK